MTTQPGAAISKRRKFVADGVFYAELNEFFQRELAEEGYSGVELRVTPTVTDISMLPHCFSIASSKAAKNAKMIASHSGNAHSGGSWGARPPNPGTHVLDPKTLQVSRKLCFPLRS